MPVVVKGANNCEQVINNQFLLDKIEHEMKLAPIEIEYQVTTSDFDLPFLKTFFDQHYSKVKYPLQFYDWYFNHNDTILFHFYNSDGIIGYIVARNKKFVINRNPIQAMEISFFCICPRLRHIHLAPYLLNILIKECIERYNISIAFYSIIAPIKSLHYVQKLIYHRPINVKRLLENDFLDTTFDNSIFYSFDVHSDTKVIYLHKKSPQKLFINRLQQKYDKFVKDNFKIYETINLTNLFSSNLFHHFIFYDTLGSVTGFFCICTLDFNGYNQGLLYTYLCETDLNNCIEMISEYASKYKLFDVFSFYKTSKTHLTKTLCGVNSTKYYLFNYSINPIEEWETNIVHL